MSETEDKIVLKTILKPVRNSADYTYGISLASIMSAISESYEKALEIGWETKALDGLNDAVRDMINKQSS